MSTTSWPTSTTSLRRRAPQLLPQRRSPSTRLPRRPRRAPPPVSTRSQVLMRVIGAILIASIAGAIALVQASEDYGTGQDSDLSRQAIMTLVFAVVLGGGILFYVTPLDDRVLPRAPELRADPHHQPSARVALPGLGWSAGLGLHLPRKGIPPIHPPSNRHGEGRIAMMLRTAVVAAVLLTGCGESVESVEARYTAAKDRVAALEKEAREAESDYIDPSGRDRVGDRERPPPGDGVASLDAGYDEEEALQEKVGYHKFWDMDPATHRSHQRDAGRKQPASYQDPRDGRGEPRVQEAPGAAGTPEGAQDELEVLTLRLRGSAK